MSSWYFCGSSSSPHPDPPQVLLKSPILLESELAAIQVSPPTVISYMRPVSVTGAQLQLQAPT